MMYILLIDKKENTVNFCKETGFGEIETR